MDRARAFGRPKSFGAHAAWNWRDPAVTAQAAATLHLLTRGRAILGIGTGEREGNEPYGVDWSKPVARFEEAMATIRPLWNSGGELVTRDSPFFPLHNAVFDLWPYRGKWPEIWIAAHGPRMLRATGRYADAWFPAAVFSPAEYARGLGAVRAAASDAGRDPMSITGAILYFTVTGRNRQAIDDALESTALKTFALNACAELWKRHGVSHPLGDDFAGAKTSSRRSSTRTLCWRTHRTYRCRYSKTHACKAHPTRLSTRSRSGAITG